MKCHPLRWLWGLIPLAILSWVAALSIKPQVEGDLAKRVGATLAAQDLGWARLNFDGRDLVIAGKADDEDEPTTAVKLADQIRGVRVVEAKADLLQRIQPYVWSAAHKDGKVVLSGYVPNNKTRKTVLASAKQAFPRTDIVDEMELARGNPAVEDWKPAVSFALKKLAFLKSGTAKLTDRDLTVSGEAQNTAAFKDVKAALAGTAKGVGKISDEVGPPVVSPYAWLAKLTSNQVVLSGFIPSESLRTELLAAARKAFGQTPVVDRMELAAGAPKDWGKAAIITIDQLATLQDGSAELSGTQLSLSGNATDDGVAAATGKAFKSKVPGSFKTVEAIKGLRPSIPTVRPYVTRIEAQGSSIDVTGHVPSDAARDAVLKLVRSKLTGRTVNDRLQLGIGEPAGYEACLRAAIAGLDRLGTGRVTLTDGSVELVGVTEDETLASALPADVRNAAKGACDTKVNVKYDDSKKRQAAEAEAARARAEAEAAERARREGEAAAKAGAVKATAERVAAEKAAADRAAAERAAAEKAAAAERAAAKAKADAEAAQKAAADAEAAKVAAEAQRKKDVASACERKLRSTAAQGSIQFERASDVLLAESRPILRQLVDVAKTSQDVSIEIEGHTDAEGIPERNNPLSERRALSVVMFLVDNGVPADRIKAVGYGATQPIADNATAEGRAKNRRIEFTVKAK
jgi:outer membrane protein OmpA-like peptidoglycan-associated protein